MILTTACDAGINTWPESFALVSVVVSIAAVIIVFFWAASR